MHTTHSNNFDLIRLYAAIQVLAIHTAEHLAMSEPPGNLIFQFFAFLPGVEIFFFVSGYLVTASLERSPSLLQFFKNRVLRIFPALWACFFGSLLLIWLTGYFNAVDVSIKSLFIWSLSQLTFVQFYFPDFLKGFGVGALNGSLWTISVELQFYVLAPIVFLILQKKWTVAISVFIFFLMVNTAYTQLLHPSVYAETLVAKLLGVSFLPWIAFFIYGALCHLHFDKLAYFVKGRAVYWIVGYSLLALIGIAVSHQFQIRISGNVITLFHYVPLGMLILSIAYSNETLATRLLRGNDLSYGIYVYHMPIVNAWIYLEMPQSIASAYLISAISVLIAWPSWYFIERPALSLKNYSLMRR